MRDVEEVGEEAEEIVEIPKELKKLENVEGITLVDGLKYCGSSKALLTFLNSFYGSIDNKSKEIEEAFDRNDIEFYTIKVHALKSTSRIIGAMELSELARSLEEAGKENNLAYIRDNTERLLTLYKSYKNKLSVLSDADDDNDKELIPESVLEDAYNGLREVVPLMDYDTVELILGELKKYKLPDKDQKIMNELNDLLRNMEWEKMENVLKLLRH